MADHRRAPTVYPACRQGHVWRQRGNKTGHCPKCHETFEGITLYDAHLVQTGGGRSRCRNPADMVHQGVPVRLVDGSWRGPARPAGSWG